METSSVPGNDVKTDDKMSIFTTGYFSIIVTTILAVAIMIYIRRAIRGGRAKSKASLHGKTVIITGSNTGIGKEAARDFARRGGRVIMACRNLDKANEAANAIRSQCPKANIVVMKLDLSSFDSIRKFAKEVQDKEPHIDILVNNAGLMCPKSRTKDGFDMMFGTNHLGTFLLTYLLLDKLKKSAPARIVTVASIGHNYVSGMNWSDLNFDQPPTYPAMKAYTHSKLANVLFSKELGRRLEGTGVTTYSLHPGFINSDFNRDTGNIYGGLSGMVTRVLAPWFFKNSVEGAQTTIYCAVDEKLTNKTGLYYSDCAEKTPSKAARDPEAAKKLWEISLKLVGIENDTTMK